MSLRIGVAIALRRALLPLASFCLVGCANVYDAIEHGLAEGNHLLSAREHPWHSGPGCVTFEVVTIVVFVPLLPVFLAESLIFHEPMKGGRQVSKLVAGSVGAIAGSVVAVPLFVLGLPWESGGASDTEQPEPKTDEDKKDEPSPRQLRNGASSGQWSESIRLCARTSASDRR